MPHAGIHLLLLVLVFGHCAAPSLENAKSKEGDGRDYGVWKPTPRIALRTTCFNCLRAAALIAANPFEHLTDDDRPAEQESKQAHEWTQDELGALLAASEEHALQATSKANYTPLLRLVACVGLRLGEVLGLRWEDFDWEAGTLKVQRQWTRYGYGPTKTKAGVRTLYLPPDELEALRGLRVTTAFPLDEHPIFA